MKTDEFYFIFVVKERPERALQIYFINSCYNATLFLS